MPQNFNSIEELVQGFAKHIRALKAPETKEASVRQNYIDPFWRALGWDVGDSRKVGPADAEVIIENNVETTESTGVHNRAVDYLFRVNGFPRFVVEAKKPAVDLDTDKEAIFQTKRYAWNKTIPFAILTDFEQFRLYDTTLKPIINEPGRGSLRDFAIDFQDFPAKWEEFLATFGRVAVGEGSLERLLAQVKKVKAGRRLRTVDRMLVDLKGSEPVDAVFLDYLERFRQHFAQAIYQENKKAFPDGDTLHGAARLTEAVQRLIDRLVFIRVCEDRGISPYGGLREMLERIGTEGGDFYAALCAHFRDLDREYNGYLFKFHFSETLTIPGDKLADFVRTLYPPESPWDFARIGDDILGIVYERFLGHTVTVKHGEAVVEEKPEVRHTGGVYYTPRFIVDSIIRRVIGPQIAGKTPAQILDVRVLDPACGSGSFLVAAFQYLIDHSIKAIEADPALATVPAGPKARKKKKEIAFKNLKGRWLLAPDFKAALLTSCIHGADIDQQAVEVTVMSLYLKMLEGDLPPNWQHDWLEKELLPTLDNNIVCGNSLISHADFDEYLVSLHGNLFPVNEDIRFRINRFDWESRTRGFGRFLDSRAATERGRAGFDCIIGNPPYIRVQELNKWAPEECEFYKWKYASAKKGNYDIYVVFTEKALSLLSENGLLGFIMPHKFWQAQYGEGLRQLISDGKRLLALVDFGDQQVFKGATTYTAIHIFDKTSKNNGVDYVKVLELDDGPSQCAGIDKKLGLAGVERFAGRQPEGSAPWVFSNAAVAKWLDAVRAGKKTLGEITYKIAQGLVSGCDPVFYVERRGNQCFSEHTGRLHMIEDDLLHPLLKGSLHIRRWAMDPTPLSVIFPYRLEEGAWRLIDPDAMKNEYPRANAYFLECRAQLEEREKKEIKDTKGETTKSTDGTSQYERPFAGADFYRFSRPQNFEVMPRAKLLVPAMAQRSEYAIDEKGEFYFVGSGGGGGGAHAILPNIDLSLEYLCGLLNSKCLDKFLQKVTTPFHSGWYAYSKLYIAQIPIKTPMTVEEKKLAESIAAIVRAIMDTKAKLRTSALSDREKTQLESEIEAGERRIDETVLRLYGVDEVPE